jgi:hypothetical protein
MTPQNVVDMLEGRGVIDKDQAYDISQDAVKNGKDVLQVLLDYGVYNNEDEFWATVAEEIGAEHFDLAEFAPPPGSEFRDCPILALFGPDPPDRPGAPPNHAAPALRKPPHPQSHL